MCVVLDVPASTPKTALLWETGSLLMSTRVMQRKLNLINFIKKLDPESLSKQVFQEQRKHGWPGPVKESDKICSTLNLPSIANDDVSRREIEQACKEKTEKDLKEKMKKSSKLKDKIEERFEQKEYFKNIKIHEARTMFRARSKMLNCKMNYSSDPKFMKELWLCDSCERAIDQQSHVMICSAYSNLREGRDINNDEDVAWYRAEVMKIRNKMGFRK